MWSLTADSPTSRSCHAGAHGEQVAVEREEPAVGVVDVVADAGGVELVGEQPACSARPGRRERPAGEPAVAVARRARRRPARRAAAWRRPRRAPTASATHVGLGEALQPQAVQHQRAEVGRVCSRRRTPTSVPPARPRPVGAATTAISPSASWNISYSSPVSAQSSNWMTPSSSNFVAQPAVVARRAGRASCSSARSWRTASAGTAAAAAACMHEPAATLRVDAHALPHLLLEEPVAHAHGGLEGELLALADLGVGQLLVVLLQRQHAEGDVAGLVAHHVAEQLLEQRLGGQLVHEAEGGEGQALHHDLHAEVGHVPPAVLDDVVEQQLQVGVDRVVARQLVSRYLAKTSTWRASSITWVDGVVLGVDPRHGLDDLGGADQRALLAVHELAERPVLALDAELEPLLVAPLLERRAGDGRCRRRSRRSATALAGDDLLLVDVGVPRQVGLAVPLRRLGLLVELVRAPGGRPSRSPR